MKTKIFQTPTIAIDRAVIDRLDSFINRGLCSGIGKRNGQMCIEAAVCAALNLPHGDDPLCVAKSVRAFKISLNDCSWSCPEARAKGLRDLGVAQLGSKEIVDDKEFTKRLADKVTRKLIPALFRKHFKDEAMLKAADRCEQEGTSAAASAASYAASDAASAASAAASAASAAASDAASYAASAASAASYASYAASAASYASYAASAASAASSASYAASAASDEMLILVARLALEALKELKSPGCEFLNN